MKNILFVLLAAIVSIPSFAQKNEYGEMRDEVLYLNNGITIKKGMQLEINGPSGEDAYFVYLFHAPENLFDDVKVKLTKRAEPYNSKRTVTVRKIKFAEDKDSQGGKWIVRVRDGRKTDFMCDIVPALNIGEISTVSAGGVVIPVPAAAPVTATDNNATSPNAKPGKNDGALPVGVADELLKLKQLMDDGIITKEEFESQKKKLLER